MEDQRPAPESRALFHAKTKKRDLDRARAKTRINIGTNFRRWRELRARIGLKTDVEVALFLLSKYENHATISAVSSATLSDREGFFMPGISDIDERTLSADEVDITTLSIHDVEEDIGNLQNNVIYWTDETCLSSHETEECLDSDEEADKKWADDASDEDYIPPPHVRVVPGVNASGVGTRSQL
ncbi:hypothetical protein SKAU_G00200570 [Synaphobranchus kaupii]|uniref:Uncharacterized protein n=1 Tax=Synaphobranchus kaupii TaxID=118154 RepID=A0A9Q1IY57_SYNKA|nr:hypothetical protein SKAU_G00200570 [Synaphobranchus kaupii]